MNIRFLIDAIDEIAFLAEGFDMERFLRRAQSVQSLIDRGSTEGERSAAKLAMERLVAQARLEASSGEIAAFERHLVSIRGGAKTSSSSSTKNSRSDSAEEIRKARERARQEATGRAWRAERDRAANEAGAFRILNFARFVEGTSNKIYGVAQKDGWYYTFWGRYGSVPSTKAFTSNTDAYWQFSSKIAKGYVSQPIPDDIRAMVLAALP